MLVTFDEPIQIANVEGFAFDSEYLEDDGSLDVGEIGEGEIAFSASRHEEIEGGVAFYDVEIEATGGAEYYLEAGSELGLRQLAANLIFKNCFHETDED